MIRGRTVGEPPAHAAIRSGQTELSRSLIESSAAGATDVLSPSGDSALHVAADSGNLDAIRMLINAPFKINIDITNGEGRTPLHLAARSDRSDAVSRLVLEGAVIDKKDAYGRTPLHYAAEGNYLKCIRILIEKNADFLIEDFAGISPRLLLAANRAQAEIATAKVKGHVTNARASFVLTGDVIDITGGGDWSNGCPSSEKVSSGALNLIVPSLERFKFRFRQDILNALHLPADDASILIKVLVVRDLSHYLPKDTDYLSGKDFEVIFDVSVNGQGCGNFKKASDVVIELESQVRDPKSSLRSKGATTNMLNENGTLACFNRLDSIDKTLVEFGLVTSPPMSPASSRPPSQQEQRQGELIQTAMMEKERLKEKMERLKNSKQLKRTPPSSSHTAAAPVTSPSSHTAAAPVTSPSVAKPASAASESVDVQKNPSQKQVIVRRMSSISLGSKDVIETNNNNSSLEVAGPSQPTPMTGDVTPASPLPVIDGEGRLADEDLPIVRSLRAELREKDSLIASMAAMLGKAEGSLRRVSQLEDELKAAKDEAFHSQQRVLYLSKIQAAAMNKSDNDSQDVLAKAMSNIRVAKLAKLKDMLQMSRSYEEKLRVLKKAYENCCEEVSMLVRGRDAAKGARDEAMSRLKTLIKECKTIKDERDQLRLDKQYLTERFESLREDCASRGFVMLRDRRRQNVNDLVDREKSSPLKSLCLDRLNESNVQMFHDVEGGVAATISVVADDPSHATGEDAQLAAMLEEIQRLRAQLGDHD